MEKSKYNIGIVGLGFVGGATNEVMKDFHNVFTYDTEKDSTCDSMQELVDTSDFIFVCVPTPMTKSGKFDLSIVKNVVNDIEECATSKKIIILKSTSIPETTKNFQSDLKKCQIVFNPEFLTEKNFIEDFRNQTFIIIGGDSNASIKVKEMYEVAFPDCEYFLTNSTIAETVKYTINNFLSLKVSFANEIYSVCKKLDINYDEMINMAMQDQRLGQSHWAVPGHDGKFGYSGSCFPKDVSALRVKMQEMGVSSYIVDACLRRNIELDRPEKDWELLSGRAVSDNE